MFIYKWLGVDSALIGNIRDLFFQHVGLLSGRLCSKVCKSIWFVTIWSLWLHRNDMIFKQESLNFNKVTDLFKIRIWTWYIGLINKSGFSFTDWYLSPSALSATFWLALVLSGRWLLAALEEHFILFCYLFFCCTRRCI